jgi:hypothetical protein
MLTHVYNTGRVALAKVLSHSYHAATRIPARVTVSVDVVSARGPNAADDHEVVQCSQVRPLRCSTMLRAIRGERAALGQNELQLIMHQRLLPLQFTRS